MHVRQSIRDNITTTLTGLPSTGSNVYQTRVYPIAPDKLPGIAVYTRSESSDYLTVTIPRTLVRTLTVSVEAYVQGSDNDLDAISASIEEALAVDVTRGGYAKDTRVVSFEADFSGDSDQPVGSAVVQVEIDYVTIEGNPEVAA